MSDNPRVDELKRRVQQDPASIAFAALADEYRRLGLFHDAIETCRAGLVRHPAYLSARVTLGRALLEIGEYDEAQSQLEQVVRVAPDNLAAIRALADIHHRRGDTPDGYAADPHPPAAAVSPPAPAVQPTSAALPKPPAQPVPAAQSTRPAEPTPAPEPAPAVEPASPLASVARATDNPVALASSARHAPGAARSEDPAPVLSLAPRANRATETARGFSPPPSAGVVLPEAPVPVLVDPVCERLEQFLAAIDRARAAVETDRVHDGR